MNKTILILLAVSILMLFVPLPSPGAVVEYMNSTGFVPVKVASSTPLPVNIVADSSGTSASPTSVIGNVNTNIVNGFGTVLTVTVGTSAAVLMPTLPVSTRKIWITTNAKVNIGGATVSSSTTGINFIPANAPGFPFSFATSTPVFYFIAQSATATVRVSPGIEP